MQSLIFVHGSGGSFTKTFTTKLTTREPPIIWPRDVLPSSLEKNEQFGRYWSFGHSIQLQQNTNLWSDVSREACSLVTGLLERRSEGEITPIYFFCHGVGGLIVCKAILDALGDREMTETSTISAHTRQEVAPEGRFLVKGVALIGSLYKGIESYHDSTRKLLTEFDSLRLQQRHNIGLLIISDHKEKSFIRSLIGRKTDESNGLHPFKENFSKITIHQDLDISCSFTGTKDDREWHSKVYPCIHELIVRGFSPETSNDHILVMKPHQLRALGVTATDSSQSLTSSKAETFNLQVEMKSLGHLSKSDASIARVLGFSDLSKSFDHIAKPIDGTCLWALETASYRAWVEAPQDSCLLLRGGLGMGKSVILRSIADNLRQTRDVAKTIIVTFSFHGVLQPDLCDIIRHIMYHLWLKFPDEVLAIRMQSKHIKGTNLRFPQLWEIFTATRKAIKEELEIFWIFDEVDGRSKDSHVEKATNINSSQISFIEHCLRYLTTERAISPMTVKFLATARPTVDIGQLILSFPDINTLDIRVDDINDDLSIFIEDEVAKFCKKNTLGSDYEEYITTQLKQNNGYTFRWPQVILQEINVLDDLRDFEKVVQNIQPPDINKNYLDQLKNMSLDQRVSAQDKQILGFAFRIMGSSFCSITAEELAIATACAIGKMEPEYVEARSKALFRAYYGCIIAPWQDVAYTYHISVAKFFKNLSPLEWPDFSCADSQREDEMLTIICLGYLDYWFSKEIPESLYASNSFSLIATHIKGPFVKYCVQKWSKHVRALSALDAVWDVISQFLLHPDETNYRLLCIALKAYSVGEPKWEDWEVPPLENTLASLNLDSIIEKALQPRNLQAKSTAPPKFPWLHRTSNRAKPLSLDLSTINHEGCTMLYSAAAEGAIDTIRLLISKGARGDVTTKLGQTPFWAACKFDCENAALTLINMSQAFLEEPDSSQISSLQFAVVRGMEQTVEWILTAGMKSPNDTTGLAMWSPFYVACDYGKVGLVVKMLDRFDADPTVKTKEGWVPLHACAKKGHWDIMQLILTKVPTINLNPLDNNHLTPSHYAAAAGHLIIFSYIYDRTPQMILSDKGWSPVHDAAYKGQVEILKYVKKSELELPTLFGSTPLHIAAEKDQDEVVKYLLERGVDDNAKYESQLARKFDPVDSSRHVTPLLRALDTGAVKVSQALLSSKSVDLSVIDGNGRNLLQVAARKCNTEIVRELYNRGVNPLASDRYGITPYHTAANQGNVDVFKYLVELGQETGAFDIDIRTGLGNTPLLDSVKSENLDFFKYILSLGAKINNKDILGCTILHYASHSKDADIVEHILEQKVVDIDERNRYGMTALHSCASTGYLPVLKMLLKNGADINLQNYQGHTALMLATSKDKKELTEELLSAGADTSICDVFGETAIDKITTDTSEIVGVYKAKGLIGPRWRRSKKGFGTRQSVEQKIEIDLRLKQRLRDFILLLESSPTLPPSHIYLDATRINTLVRGFSIQDKSEFRSLREMSLTRMRNGDTWFCGWCDLCLRERWKGTLHTCKECYDVDLCQDCYEKHASGEKRLEKCDPKHEYFAAGGPDWWERPEGIANDLGETEVQFMQRMKEKYCSDEAEVQDSSNVEDGHNHTMLLDGEMQTE